ncbi:MAG: HIT family hydrolase [Candidatus Rokuibacteriota bacterium]|nr:MAG: HIT family hydrolase [Candidatus Rokubacteria bacterium]
MNVLWAPWRMAYLRGGHATGGCLLCELPELGDDTQPGILERKASAYLVLNAFPYATGHLMAVATRHVASLEELTEVEAADLVRVTQRGVSAVRQEYRPDGFNLGANIGRAAGAGVEGHLHVHIVPRWSGDTNFMPVVGSVKVMPESLEETFRRLAPYFAT